MKEQLRKIVREIMREISISELDEAQSPAQKAAFEKMLAKKDGKDVSDDSEEETEEVKESINEVDTKKAEQIRKAASGYVGPKFAKKASDEDILAMADLKDEKASLYNRHLKDIMGKISKLQKKYNIKESVTDGTLNESPSSEELRIVMMAVRKIAKYRNVPIEQSIVDVANAVEQLERDIKKGKIKK